MYEPTEAERVRAGKERAAFPQLQATHYDCNIQVFTAISYTVHFHKYIWIYLKTNNCYGTVYIHVVFSKLGDFITAVCGDNIFQYRFRAGGGLAGADPNTYHTGSVCVCEPALVLDNKVLYMQRFNPAKKDHVTLCTSEDAVEWQFDTET